MTARAGVLRFPFPRTGAQAPGRKIRISPLSEFLLMRSSPSRGSSAACKLTYSTHSGAYINGSRGFIKNEDRGVLQEGASQRDPLPLSPRETHSSFPDERAVTVGKEPDELIGVGGFRGPNDLFKRRLRAGVSNVLRDAGGEQH